MDQIDELLTRGVANIIPSREQLEKVLRSDKKLNIYLGVDPTAPKMHLGHAVPLRKLQQFVDLGHHVTFLIGDFTTLVGDTSDKDAERPIISDADIETNWQTYATQAGLILDLSKVKVVRNSDWLDKLSSREIVKLIRQFSLNDFNSRELIKKRLTSGGSVNLAEAIYPVLQGYDSYYLDTDIQVGATDQTFNMQAGRYLQKKLRGKDSFVLSFDFLMGTDGRKMSKSWGNAIWLEDSPEDIYGKVMSLNDNLLEQYYLLGTNLPTPDLSSPLLAKKQLAFEITQELHDEISAQKAQKYFENTVQSRQIPSVAPTKAVTSNNIVDVLVQSGLASSNSDARRKIDQGGIRDNGQKVSAYNHTISSDTTISLGTANFVKIINASR